MHPQVAHTYDHDHVSYHHTGGLLGEFEHRAHDHRHEHDHAPLLHAHDAYSEEQERADHLTTAHVHDHDAPVDPGRSG
jgi:hypothetical protein